MIATLFFYCRQKFVKKLILNIVFCVGSFDKP
nr:MAG TPA: hypothetical protein [Caudoviricetes sp.]